MAQERAASKQAVQLESAIQSSAPPVGGIISDFAPIPPGLDPVDFWTAQVLELERLLRQAKVNERRARRDRFLK